MQKHCMMPHQTNRLSCKSPLSVFSALIFHHAVVFLLLTHSHGAQSQETGQPQLIVAMVGDDITLPCHVEPATDAVNEMLEWSRPDLDPRFVHVRRSGEDRLGDQNPSYKGRTSAIIDRLKQGDASLKLLKVKLSDEGTYRCFIPGLNTESRVQLIVGVVIEMTEVSSGVLECKSKGWYPEPEVFWLDGEGNLLSAGPTETVRGPDDLYTVSSRVTVEKRHSNSFTCRVQQKNINQTRETNIHVPDDFFMDSSSSSASIIIGLVVGILFILAVAFAVWKWRQNKINTKKHHEDEETQRGRERKTNSKSNDSEQKCLIKRETDRDQLTGETMKNQNKVEEENNIESLNEETGTTCQKEEETHQEKLRTEGETNNILTQREGDIEKQSANAGAGSQFVMENGRQQHEVQTGGETMNDLDNRAEETKSISEETQAPGPAERGTHQEKPEKNVDERNGEEETKSVNTEIAGQGLKDGDGQRQQITERRAETDLDKEHEEKIKSTNNEPAGQSPTEGETQQNETQAGREIKTEGETNLVSNETERPCPQMTETHQEKPEKNVDKRNGEEETKSVNTETEGQGLMDGGGQQQQAMVGGEATNDLDEENEEEEIKPTNNETAGQGPTEGETQQNNLTAGGGTTNYLEKREETETELINEEKDTPCPAEREGQQEKNRDGGDGGQNTTPRKENTRPLSPVDGQKDQLQAREVQSDLDKTDEDEKTKSTNNETAGQAPIAEERQQDELQAGGKRKTEEIETDAQPENTDSRDREEDMTSREEDTITDEPPAGEVKSDVENTEEEKEKTGLPCQTEGEPHEKQLIKGQPEKQVEEDGDEGTTPTNNKAEHQAEVNEDTEKELHVAGRDTKNDVEKGQRVNESPSVTEETGLHGAEGKKKRKKSNRKRSKE